MNIFSLVFAGNKPDPLLYKDFDPQDKNEYEQVLELMTRDRLFLLDPDEDPKDVLQLYIKSLNGAPDDGYQGLKLKLLVQSGINQKNNKVLGFISYQYLKENKQQPLVIRTIAIDSEYRRKGLAKYLFSEVRQEAMKLHKKHICLAVYSNNDSMLSLLKKEKFELFKEEKKSAFSLYNLKTQEQSFVYTFLMCKELPSRAF